jgi:tRNA pseudouridine38-40 synthase
VGNTKQRYFIELLFNGTRYHGWQIQDNAITVQAVIDKSLSTVLRQDIKTVGCGRTDTGVHAKQLFAHFDCILSDAEVQDDKIKRSLNAILPNDIAVKNIFRVPHDFHARFSATSRSYEYYIHFEKDPFLDGLSWYLRDKPDLIKMSEAAKIMMEYRDFSCFSKAHTQVFTNNCEIYQAEWQWISDNRLRFNISANRFLRNMVRAIVGTLIEIGNGRNTVESIRSTIESQNRSQAGTSVPACGLYLSKVVYPDMKS